jgi:HK97 family phage major capsid protein
MYVFKYIKLPEDHGFDEKQLTFLQTIDEGFVKSAEGISKKEDIETIKAEFDAKLVLMKKDVEFEKLQKQINDVYVALEKKGLKPADTKEEKERKEKDFNNQWIRSLIRKDKEGMKKAEMELKVFQSPMEPILHLGLSTDEIREDFTQGGYLIPEMLLAEVNRFVISGGIARREFRYLPFSGAGNSRYIPTLLTNVVVSWVDEGETKPKTKPTIDRVEQTLKKLAAIVLLTEEIVEDAIIDLVSFCGQLLGEAVAAEEDNQFFSGTGAPWTGIINNAAVVGVTLAAGVGPLDMRPEVLLAMTIAVPEGAVPGAKFYMHRGIWAAICARRSDAVVANDTKGGYLIQQPSQGSPGSIWGFPVVLVEAMPSLTDLGYADQDDECDPDLPFLIFGNLQKCVVYGDKQGLRVKVLDQASVYDDSDNLINLAERDMIALRVHKRVGYVVILPAGIAVLSTGPVS